MSNSRLFNNIISLGSMQLVNYIAPVIVLLYLTNVLSMEIYGVVSFSIGISIIGFIILDFGYSLSATNKISINRNKKKYLNSIVNAVLCVKIILFSIVVFFFLLFIFTTEKYEEHQLILLLTLFPIFFQGVLPVWYFQGIEKMKSVAMYTAISKVVYVVSTVLLVKGDASYYMIPICLGLSNMFSLIVSIYLVRKDGLTFFIPKRRYIQYVLEFNRGFFLSRVAVATYLQSGTFLLGVLSTPVNVAIYSVAEQFYKVMQNAISPIAQAIYPYMAKEKNFSLYFKIVFLCVGLISLLSIIGYFFSPFLIQLFLEEKWLVSLDTLNVFFFAILIHALAVFFGYPLCAAFGNVNVANISVIYGAVVYFLSILVVFFLDMINPVSMALMMLFAEFSVLIYRFYHVWPSIESINNKVSVK